MNILRCQHRHDTSTPPLLPADPTSLSTPIDTCIQPSESSHHMPSRFRPWSSRWNPLVLRPKVAEIPKMSSSVGRKSPQDPVRFGPKFQVKIKKISAARGLSWQISFRTKEDTSAGDATAEPTVARRSTVVNSRTTYHAATHALPAPPRTAT